MKTILKTAALALVVAAGTALPLTASAQTANTAAIKHPDAAVVDTEAGAADAAITDADTTAPDASAPDASALAMLDEAGAGDAGDEEEEEEEEDAGPLAHGDAAAPHASAHGTTKPAAKPAGTVKPKTKRKKRRPTAPR